MGFAKNTLTFLVLYLLQAAVESAGRKLSEGNKLRGVFGKKGGGGGGIRRDEGQDAAGAQKNWSFFRDLK